MNKQCPSCGGDCGRTNMTGCQYKGRDRNILATGEMDAIKATISKWGCNTMEACIACYLLGINQRRRANFLLSDDALAAMSKAEAAWGTGNTPSRESSAFKDGYHAALIYVGFEGDD